MNWLNHIATNLIRGLADLSPSCKAAARLQSELRHSSPHDLSERDIARDWNLLQQTLRPPRVSEGKGLSAAGSMSALGALPSNSH